MTRKKFTRFIFVAATIIGCVIVMILVALPVIADTPLVKRYILDIISETSRIKIEAESFQIWVFPHPRVEMKNITLTKLGSGEHLGTGQELDLAFPVLPLIFQSVVVTHGTLVKPVFVMSMDPQETSRRMNGGGSWLPSSIQSQWHIQTLQITDGEVTVIRPTVQGQAIQLAWSNIELTLNSGMTRLPLDVQLSGTQPNNTGTQNFSLTGKITRNNSVDSSVMSGDTQNNAPLQFIGELNFTELALRPFLEFIHSESLPTSWSATGQLHTPIDIMFDGIKWNVTFSNMKGQINDLHIQGKGFVIGEPGSTSGIFFQGSSSTIRIKSLQNLVLPVWVPPNLHSTLLHHQVEGTLEVLTATIAGTLDDEEPLSVIGALKISEGQGHILSDLPPLKNIIALAILTPRDHLTISGIQADYGSSHLLPSKIQIAFSDTVPEYTANLGIAWMARDVVNAMITFPKTRDLLAPLLPIEEVRGEGALDIQLTGPLTDFTLAHIQKAKSIIRHVEFRSQALPLSINDWSGLARWHQHELSVQKLAGSIGNSQVEFSGIFSKLKSPHLRNGILQAETDVSDIRTLYPEILQTDETVSGKMKVVTNISGPLPFLKYDGRIDLQDLTLSFPSLLHKPDGVPAWLVFSVTENTPGTFVADSMSFNLPPFALNGQGQFSTDNGLAFEGTFRSHSVDIDSTNSRVILGGPGFSPDHLDVSLDIQGTSPHWTQWQLAGSLVASETSLPTNAERNAPKEMTLQVNLQDQMVNMNVRTDGLPFEAIMKALGNESPPLQGNLSLQGTLNIQTSDQHLATDSSTGNFTFRISNGHINHITAVSRILGILNLPSLLMGKVNLLDDGMPFDHITGTLSIQHGIVNSDDLLVNSPVMKLAAAGNYDFLTDQLNGVVAASPFGAYSELLKSTPLFGQLLTGDRQGLTTALFKVTGSRQEPKVQYQPLDSFAGGVKGMGQLAVDMLTNFINIPTRVLDPTEKAPSLENKQTRPHGKDPNSNLQGD